jgi:hypothetical protein
VLVHSQSHLTFWSGNKVRTYHPRLEQVRFAYQNPIRVAPTLAPWNPLGFPPQHQQPPVPVGPFYPPPATPYATIRPVLPTLQPATRSSSSRSNMQMQFYSFSQIKTNVSLIKTFNFRGCPNDELLDNGAIRKYRLDRITRRCFPLGSSEPCGGKARNMAFYGNLKDNIHGECECLQDTNRPLVYHPATQTCYFVFQQVFAFVV